MTESQKRNARRRRAEKSLRGIAHVERLQLSFRCTFWSRSADFDRHFILHEGWYLEKVLERMRQGDVEWGDWRDDRRWPNPDHHFGEKIQMSTVDIPPMLLHYQQGQEDTSGIAGQIKGVLHALIKSIVPGLNPLDRSDRSLSEQLREFVIRLECEGQWGQRAPWRLKWHGVDEETVVADVIAAICTQDRYQSLATL